MRRTDRAGRGRRFAAAAAVGAVLWGWSAGPASAADSIRAQEWHLDAMHADEMWRTSTGKGVVVAVIDTGVQGDAPDLAGQLVPGTDLSGLSGGVLSDPVGHGTHMASDIAGTGKGLNGQGAYGLAPGAKILPVKLNDTAGGTVQNDDRYVDQLSQGIGYAADHGAKVINISGGIGGLSAANRSKLQAAVDHANSRGALVVAATGNEGDAGKPVDYPAALPGVVGVAGADRDGKAWAKSQTGPQVALAAPAVEIYGACTGASGYCKGDGTSDSAAFVSASAALIWSAHPDWTANQVLRVLINTASGQGQRSDFLGYGVIRPRIALTTPGDPGPADVSPLPAAAGSGGGAASPAPSNGAGARPSGAASGGAGAPPAASAAPSAAPVAEGKGSSGSGKLPLIVGGAVAGVLVLVLVVVLVVRRNRSAGSGPGPLPPVAPYGAPPQQPYGQQPPAAPPVAPGYGQQPPAPQPYGAPPAPPAYGQQQPAPPAYGQQPPSGGNPYAG
ncbi:type VII secretion-associated serine protease mycosin [Kitasatospora sp. NPDC001540]|uniref:type VII secretion-associated serine protease mycosin n=1 Tax=Kitasatospora sp. NPDC001540 TaxID=3364014 RepID=UPI0036A8C0A2